MKQKQRGEPATQFDEIYAEYHNPQNREMKKILANRKKREEDNKEDLGI